MGSAIRAKLIILSCLILSFPVAILGQTLVFPHVADGLISPTSRWSTEIDLINTTSSPQTATVYFFKPDGTTKCFQFGRPWPTYGCPFSTVDLQPNEMEPVIIDSAFSADVPVATAWALVEGTGGIKGLLIFRRIEGPYEGKIIAECEYGPAAPSNSVEFFPRMALTINGAADNTNIPYTGYAIANPDPTLTAKGEIQLFTHWGTMAGTSSFTLPPHGQISKFLEETFGPINNADPVYARIVVSQGQVSAIGLRSVGDSIASIPGN